MTTPLSVSVIIPAHSCERLVDLKKTVASLRSQSRVPREVTIAIDHNEALLDMLTPVLLDGTIKAVLNAGTLGGAETRNVGIKSASGDIVVFIDDDAWAAEDWLEHLVAPYEDPSVIAVGGKTISTWDGGRPRWFPEELDWLVGGTWKGHPEGPCEVRNLIGPNMSFRREVCDQVGYMRPELGALGSSFRAGDETEFYIRLKHHYPNHKILYEPTALVYHRVYRGKITPTKLCLRSYSLGYYKSRATEILRKSTSAPFSTERSFLSYLLLGAIPAKLRRGELFPALAIAASILSCGLGYVRGKAGND